MRLSELNMPFFASFPSPLAKLRSSYASRSFPDLPIQDLEPRYQRSSDKMGQQQGKLASAGMDISRSTGPDPTVFRPQTHHVSHSLPPAFMAELPHSAPPMAQSQTGETFTRIDYGPTSSQYARTISKPRHLVRKLSQKTRGIRMAQDTNNGKSVGEELEDFDTLVTAAESRAGIEAVPRTTKASAFSATRAKRLSISSAVDGPTAGFAPPHLPQHMTTPYARPQHHRRSSSNSGDSSRTSTKTARRAEKEWRAMVAGLAKPSMFTPPTTDVRGPVPPKRTPAPVRSASDKSDSPNSDIIVTPPPHAAIPGAADKGTPARSIISNTSFETLGHHAHARPMTIDPELSTRDRKASVPHSVSSFYFEPSGTRLSRPSSFAANQLLATIPSSQCGSPLRQSTYLLCDDDAEALSAAPTPSSLIASPVQLPFSIGRVPPLPARPESPLHGQAASLSPCRARGASTPVSTFFPPLTPRRLPAPLTVLPARHGSSQPSNIHSPHTPVSPTTQFILTAPLENIDWSVTRSAPETPEQPGKPHPYATLRIQLDSTAPPTPPASSPIVERTLSATPACLRPGNGSNSTFPPATSKLPAIDRAILRDSRTQSAAQKEDKRYAVPQGKRTPFKAYLVGSGAEQGFTGEREDLRRQRDKLKKLGVDLTPGMETGNRPPKSGLPITDLQNWLRETSLAA